MDRRERERIMREGGTRESSTIERADAQRLAEDLESSPLRGKPLPRRLRNFRPGVDSYVASLGGPLPYMQRLRELERATERHAARLAEAWDELAAAYPEPLEFARRWRAAAERWVFADVNDLIARHNRYFPIESRLPMDPRTGDFVLLDGAHYERRPLDADWILERFPADLTEAA